MSVSLHEHRLGGLRWIVLNGPDRETFGALGEHVREELAGLTDICPRRSAGGTTSVSSGSTATGSSGRLSTRSSARTAGVPKRGTYPDGSS